MDTVHDYTCVRDLWHTEWRVVVKVGLKLMIFIIMNYRVTMLVLKGVLMSLELFLP